MKNKNFESICKKIALEEGISVKKVKKEMKLSIASAFENPTQEQKLIQDSIPRKGEIPTPEELINFIVKQIN